jgi:uncharacterized membrane protein YfcA
MFVYAAASFGAGIVNTLAGGGSFMTFPALLLTGLDPRAANITSTVALYPMQVTTGYAGRTQAGGTQNVRFRTLFGVSVAGGAVGAVLLLLTPPAFFGKLVPWLILFATGMFAWGAFSRRRDDHPDALPRFGKASTLIAQSLISVYGGYFGGGIGILMLAALTVAGMHIKKAGATKNILAAAMNGSALLIFVFSKDVAWQQVGIGILASVAGGMVGVRLMHKVDEKKLRIFVIVWGTFLAAMMFLRD